MSRKKIGLSAAAIFLLQPHSFSIKETILHFDAKRFVNNMEVIHSLIFFSCFVFYTHISLWVSKYIWKGVDCFKLVFPHDGIGLQHGMLLLALPLPCMIKFVFSYYQIGPCFCPCPLGYQYNFNSARAETDNLMKRKLVSGNDGGYLMMPVDAYLSCV